jgi:hypothetical protein
MKRRQFIRIIRKFAQRKGTRFGRRKGKESINGNLFDYAENEVLKKTGVNQRERKK